MLILILLPLLLFSPYLTGYIFQPDSLYSDLLITHQPNAEFIRQTLAAGQGIPLWSPAIFSGYPFAANPLSGLWYPPGWLAIALPDPLGFNLTAALHLALGGVGMFLWQRQRGLRPGAALLGGLAFELLPKWSSHFAAGHVTLTYAVAWTPWLLWAEDTRAQRKGASGWLLPGLVLGLVALADVRWAAYCGLLWLAYALTRAGTPIKLRIATISLSILTAVLAAAPVLVPLAEYTRLATRSGLTGADNLLLSLPPARLLGLLFPDPGGNAETIVYSGGLALAALAAGLCLPPVRRRARFWLWLLPVALLFALGSAVPGMDVIAALPGLNLLRVPSRVLLVVGLALAVVLATVADEVIGGLQAKGMLRLALFGLAGLAGLIATGAAVLSPGEFPWPFAWGAVALTLGGLLLGFGLAGKIAPRVWLALAVLLLAADLVGVDLLSLARRSPEAVWGQGMQAGQAIALRIANQDGLAFPARVYSPSYSVPQHVAARLRLQLADGIDPLQLQTYIQYMDTATGVPRSGYSVTLPPLDTGSPQVDNAEYTPDAQRLGWLNVGYVASEYDLDAPGLALVAQEGQTRIYENTQVLPRARVNRLDGTLAAAEILDYSPNRITVQADGPGRLMLAEVNYPGWRARVDGVEAPVLSEGGLLRAVDLSAGQHRVAFTFRPLSVAVGLALGFLTWLVGGMIVLRRKAVQS